LERLWAYDRILNLQQELADFGVDADIQRAIVDLGVEYDLVTDYTSMVVVRDEVFQSLGIDRGNSKRVEAERNARAEREQKVQQRRVDQQQPMFSGKQPRLSGGGNRSGGGGALPGWQVLLMAAAALAILIRRRFLSAAG
jgi:Ca-activated chloride channel family protein